MSGQRPPRPTTGMLRLPRSRRSIEVFPSSSEESSESSSESSSDDELPSSGDNWPPSDDESPSQSPIKATASNDEAASLDKEPPSPTEASLGKARAATLTLTSLPFCDGTMSLASYVNKVVTVMTNDGRILIGTLISHDAQTNLVLKGTKERILGDPASKTVTEESHLGGLYMIRGSEVVLCGLVDEALDGSINWAEVRGSEIRSTKND